MKYVSCIAFLFAFIKSPAQVTEEYYDYKWQPSLPQDARFYSTLQKTDSGWLRNDYYMSTKKLQMRALYEDKACKVMNGNCAYYHANGSASSIGRQIKNKKEGVYVSFYPTGVMSDSGDYHNGIAKGSRYHWHRNGWLADSISHVNDSVDVQVSWFEDGQVSSAGYWLRQKMNAKWQFFYHNGRPSSIEIYNAGIPLSKTYFNETGVTLTDTANVNREAEFPGGSDKWNRWLAKKVYWPPGYEFTNGDRAVVVIEFTVNEEGKVQDVDVYTPFHPEFDRIALHTVTESPLWRPAISHNRKVTSRFRQPVTFQQTE